MHIILDEELGEFFDLLKLRWALFNPENTLKVYNVPEDSLLQYLPDNKYTIQNFPPDKYRDKSQEVISNNEYLEIQSGKTRSESIEQSSTEFDFEPSREGNDTPSKTDYVKGEINEKDPLMQNAQSLKGELSEELL